MMTYTYLVRDKRKLVALNLFEWGYPMIVCTQYWVECQRLMKILIDRNRFSLLQIDLNSLKSKGSNIKLTIRSAGNNVYKIFPISPRSSKDKENTLTQSSQLNRT